MPADATLDDQTSTHLIGATRQRTRLALDTVPCARGAERIARRMASIQGVRQAVVDRADGVVVVDHHRDVTPRRLRGAIASAGYAAPGPVRGGRWQAAVAVAVAIAIAVLGHLDVPDADRIRLVLAALCILIPGWSLLHVVLHGVSRLAAHPELPLVIAALLALGLGAFGVLAPERWPGSGPPPDGALIAAGIVAIALVTRLLHGRLRRRACAADDALRSRLPQRARVQRNATLEVDATAVAAGETILVQAGEAVPVDGVVIDGRLLCDERLIGGGDRVERTAGHPVVAGSTVRDGEGRIRTTACGEATLVARLADHLRRVRGQSVPAARPNERLGIALVPLSIGLALVFGPLWGLFGAGVLGATVDPWTVATFSALGVLTAAAPIAASLGATLPIALSSGRALAHGVVMLRAAALQALAGVGRVCIDKTSILTSSRPKLSDIEPLKPFTPHDLLRWTARAEDGSQHPLARAIRAAADECGIGRDGAVEREVFEGLGVKAVVDGKRVLIGDLALLFQHGVETRELRTGIEHVANLGRSPVAVAIDAEPAGVIATTAHLRPGAGEGVSELRRRGLAITMLTGDHEGVARVVAGQLGIEEWRSGVRPDDKIAYLKERQAAGERVAMVTGTDSGSVLAAADVGIAVGAGAGFAVEEADVAVLTNEIDRLPRVWDLSRALVRDIRHNLWLVGAYHVAAIPLALGALAPLGLLIHPLATAGAAAVCTVAVAALAAR